MLICLLYLYYKVVKHINKITLKPTPINDFIFVNYWMNNSAARWKVVSLDHESRFFTLDQIWKLNKITLMKYPFFTTDSNWHMSVDLISEDKDFKIYSCGPEVQMETTFTGNIILEVEDGKFVTFKPL